jgi:hypothetical protein
VREYVVHPSDFGLPVYDSRVLKVANKEESVQCIQRALANEDGPVRDVVLLNAGAALYCAGVASSVADGVRSVRAKPWRRAGAGQARPLRRRHQQVRSAMTRQSGQERGGMSDILQRIVAVKREEVAAAGAARSLASLRADAESRRGATCGTSRARCAKPSLPAARR